MSAHEDWIKAGFVSGKFGDLLRPNRFTIEFSGWPSAVDSSITNSDLANNVMGVQVSPISMDVGTINLNSWILNYFKERTDADLSITFLETHNLKIRNHFNEWMRLGFDFQSKRRGFFDDIKGEWIKIWALDNKGKKGEKCDYYREVFPFEVNDINFDMAQENQIFKTEVKFKFVIHDVI